MRRGVVSMISLIKHTSILACIFSLSSLVAGNRNVGIAKERKIPQSNQSITSKNTKKSSAARPNYDNTKAFTGKVLGNGVRIRLQPDVESPIIRELYKNEMIIVTGEKNDFYAIEAPSELKVYIFRSFILDNIVEGNRVNVRLAPELSAPVVGFMNTGDKVQGTISDKNHKWLEITPPNACRFFVAKEFVEKIGGPELKIIRDKKKDTVIQLMDSADLLSQSEMMKPFEEIDFERISESFNTIINEYGDFREYAAKAKTKLLTLQETYLQKKLAYLESKASRMSREMSYPETRTVSSQDTPVLLTAKDRMKIWERVEESHFLAWAASHRQKNIDDFYEDQKVESIKISGVVETYNNIVKNKPGNFILRDRDMPKAYLYSTFVNLQDQVGKYVTLTVTKRPNNNFAFPAYFVIDVE